MSTALAELETPTRPELIEWRKQDAAIAKMAEEYMPLRVNGIDDKKGLAVVHDARMTVKNTRVAVEKKRVELKADALAYGRAVDAEAKRLTAMLAPIEEHLEQEEMAVVRERERIKKEAEEARQAAIRRRLESLRAVGYAGDMFSAVNADEATYQAILTAATADKDERDRLAEIERRRQAEEAERLRHEEAALAAERERLAAIQREQEAEAARLRAEQKRIDDEAAAQRRAAELEKAKAEAAERARVETEQRIAREQAEAKAAAEREAARLKAEEEAKEAARLKAEAEKPYRAKLESLALRVMELPIPEGPCYAAVAVVLSDASRAIRDIAAGPLDGSEEVVEAPKPATRKRK